MRHGFCHQEKQYQLLLSTKTEHFLLSHSKYWCTSSLPVPLAVHTEILLAVSGVLATFLFLKYNQDFAMLAFFSDLFALMLSASATRREHDMAQS